MNIPGAFQEEKRTRNMGTDFCQRSHVFANALGTRTFPHAASPPRLVTGIRPLVAILSIQKNLPGLRNPSFRPQLFDSLTKYQGIEKEEEENNSSRG